MLACEQVDHMLQGSLGTRDQLLRLLCESRCRVRPAPRLEARYLWQRHHWTCNERRERLE